MRFLLRAFACFALAAFRALAVRSSGVSFAAVAFPALDLSSSVKRCFGGFRMDTLSTLPPVSKQSPELFIGFFAGTKKRRNLPAKNFARNFLRQPAQVFAFGRPLKN
jgi:hypothetical protein